MKKFITSDQHFDHDNIIKYCRRPYDNAMQMNMDMENKWNSTVGPDDEVYFLGDMTYGKRTRGFNYWRDQLNGNLTCIKGNHDTQNFPRHLIIEHKGMQFLLVHEPYTLPMKWDDWVVAGHTHNNEMEKYPFINGDRKTINVSVELTDYKPVDLDVLVAMDLDNIKRQETILDKPVMK